MFNKNIRKRINGLFKKIFLKIKTYIRFLIYINENGGKEESVKVCKEGNQV